MNYLKKYRQEAGLTRTTDENINEAAALMMPYKDHTPTKETLDYLSGVKQTSSRNTTNQQSSHMFESLKTPVRRQSPLKKTPSGAKEGTRSSMRSSAMKPFSRVDTNVAVAVQKSSSRKSIKRVTSSAKSKKGMEGPSASYRSTAFQTATASGNTSVSHVFNSSRATQQQTTGQKRMAAKSSQQASSTSNLAQTRAKSGATGKKTPVNQSSIFSSVRKSGPTAVGQAFATIDQQSVFKQEATPKASRAQAKTKVLATESRSRTPLDAKSSGMPVQGSAQRPTATRKKQQQSVNLLSAQKRSSAAAVTQHRKRESGSPTSETASEKAVKDAMMKTTQKIYFLKTFKMPGKGKRSGAGFDHSAVRGDNDFSQASMAVLSPARESTAMQRQSIDRQSVQQHPVKRAMVNLETEENSIIELQRGLDKPNHDHDHLLASYAQMSFTVEQNQTFNDDYAHEAHYQMLKQNLPPPFEAHEASRIVDERSYMSIEPNPLALEDQQTDKSASRLSGGGTRRSRKDRSGIRTGLANRKATTPHVLCTLKQQDSLKTDTSPNVRMMPGSDAISLELNIKGMTEPNRQLEAAEEEEDITQASSHAAPIQQPKQVDTMASRTKVQSYYAAKPQRASSGLGGALNAFVQCTEARSRTPLINADSYKKGQSTSPLQPSRLANKILNPVQLAGHKKSGSTILMTQTCSQPSYQPVTPSRTNVRNNGDWRQNSALRSASRPLDTTTQSNSCFKANAAAPATRDRSQMMTPVRMNSTAYAADCTPSRQRSSNVLDRSRYSNVTTPIDRASESLEKINDAFRQISVGSFDAIRGVKKPSRSEMDGCAIFCRFVNAFRPQAEQCDSMSLETWQSIQTFMLHTPTCQKLCMEIQQIKKKVLRPHIQRVSEETYADLSELRDGVLLGQDERSVAIWFKSNPTVKKMVTLVLVSINHLLPATPDFTETQAPERLNERDVAHNQQIQNAADGADLSENHVVTQEQIIDLQTTSCLVAQAEELEAHAVECHSDADQSALKSAEDEANISYEPDSKINETTVHESPMQASPAQLAVKTYQGPSAVAQPVSTRYAQNDDDDNEYETHEKVIDDDIASSRGSAWPSETSRLTPIQSTYHHQPNQLTLLQQLQIQQAQAQAMTPAKALRKTPEVSHTTLQVASKPVATATRKPIEEPTTEVKRVPYRITQREEGDMFEDYSCSSDFGLMHQNSAQPTQPQCQGFQGGLGGGERESQQRMNQLSLNGSQAVINDIFNMTVGSQAQNTTQLRQQQTASKEERIRQLQAAQELIQRQIAELLAAEQLTPKIQKFTSASLEATLEATLKKEAQPACSLPEEEESDQIGELSPIRQLETNPIESPQKFSQVKASLALKQESVSKELDSILGESPSPSRQVDRCGWNLGSPDKFALKLDRVQEVQEGTQEITLKVHSESQDSAVEMSSHDLTAEEETKDRNLITFTDTNMQATLDSQRDRMQHLASADQPQSDADEQTCSEIRLDFFSPTKLSECFVKKGGASEASERFHCAIEQHERTLHTLQANKANCREQLNVKLQERLSKANEGPQSSPNTRDRKYRQMQNDIFAKIQAQLQQM